MVGISFKSIFTHFQGLFTSAGNSLSIRNKMGWKAIREVSDALFVFYYVWKNCKNNISNEPTVQMLVL